MEGGSVLGTLLAGGLLLFLGSLVAFAGYRLFLILLPIYGFFFGLSFGAHSVQALFGDGFLSTTTSWVVGFFAGLLFALLSYLFWAFAVALMAGSLGYGLVAGFFGLFGADLNFLVWIVGIVVGIVFAIAAIVLNLQKAIVIVSTALIGGWAIVGTFLFLFTSATPREHRGERREDGAGRPSAVVHHLRRRRRGRHVVPVPDQPELRGRAVQPLGGLNGGHARHAAARTSTRSSKPSPRPGEMRRENWPGNSCNRWMPPSGSRSRTSSPRRRRRSRSELAPGASLPHQRTGAAVRGDATPGPHIGRRGR